MIRTLYRLDKGFYINKSKETSNRQQIAQLGTKDLNYTNSIAQVRD